MNPILTVDQEFSSLECRSSVLDPLKKAPKLRASVMKAFCFVLAAGVMLGPACPCRAELANGIKAIVQSSNVTIQWSGNVLQAADDVNGPWTTVAGATQPYHVPAALAAKKFYRAQ